MLVNRWARVEPFNPASPKQVLAYLKHRGYKIPKDRKTHKPSSGRRTLLIIGRSIKDPAVSGVDAARQLSKARGYLSNQCVGRDGRFHSTFTFTPDTGRLASITPCLTQTPHHGVEAEVGERIRASIVPSSGMLLVELDWRAIESTLTGWFANDTGFMRLSLLDPHSYLAWHIYWRRGALDSPPPTMLDSALESKLRWFKGAHGPYRELAKRINHASSYGLGPEHLSEILQCPLAEAIEVLRIKDESAPEVARWKRTLLTQVARQGFFENPFGWRKHFFDVLRKDGSRGSEANKVLACPAQSTAAMMHRESLIWIDELQERRGDFHFTVPNHDAVLLEAKEESALAVAKEAKALLESPWPQLNGLSIPVEVKVGRNWAELSVVEV